LKDVGILLKGRSIDLITIDVCNSDAYFWKDGNTFGNHESQKLSDELRQSREDGVFEYGSSTEYIRIPLFQPTAQQTFFPRTYTHGIIDIKFNA